MNSQRKLKKELKLMDVFSIASGAMISSGLFILPGLAYIKAGPGIVLSYFFAGILAITGMLSQAELVSAMPKAGGDYFFVTRSLGPAVGTINGLLTWFSISLKSSFALIGMAAFTQLIFPYDIRIIALILCLFFLVINIMGVKEAGKFQIFLVVLLLILLSFYIIKGMSFVQSYNLVPFIPEDADIFSIFSTAGFVFVSYGGLLKIASIAEETQNPSRNIPLGMILSLLIVSILYTLTVFVTTGVLGPKLAGSLTPISDGAEAFMGAPGKIALGVAAILAFVSTANAGLMAAARYPLALSRDGLIPKIFEKISRRSQTPYVSIIFTTGFIILAVFLDLTILVKAASTVIIFGFIFSCVAVIVLRESKVQNYQPGFKSPLYPWIQILGILGFLFLLSQLGQEALLISFMMILIGFLLYWFYGKARAEKEYALLHLVERLTDRELVTGSLESELKDIIRERDEITQDRFDQIIENSIVLDLEEPLDRDGLFKIIAEKLAPLSGLKEKKLLDLLITRENQSSTVLTPTLAIPHVIVPGEKIFKILMIRSKKGIFFSKENPLVQTVFLLLGTKDERNFHLRTLSSIAQIVQSPDFEKKWLAAKNIQGLKDLVLLSKRKRY